MIKIIGDISGIICSAILILNFLSYFLKDLYMKIANIRLKKKINSILPLISKNHYLFLIFFIFLLIHIACFFIHIQKISIDILFLVLLVLIISRNFTNLEKTSYDYLKKLSSYSIIFFLIFHILKNR